MRFAVTNSSKTFAEGDVVSLGPGGQQGTILRIHALHGRCEQVDIEMHDPTREVGEETWIKYAVSPRYLVVVEEAPDWSDANWQDPLGYPVEDAEAMREP